MKRSILILLWPVLGLVACATGPAYDDTRYLRQITPAQAVAEDKSLQGTKVLWGGVVIASTNLKDATRIELLIYPLDNRQSPLLNKDPLGRVIASQPGYLEVMDYAPGRQLTLTGTLIGAEQGRLGESTYTYPLVDIDQIYLWPRGEKGKTRVQFGFGVMIHK